jgi:hypothetical protein
MKPEPTEEQIQVEADRIVQEVTLIAKQQGKSSDFIRFFLMINRWRAVREARANLASP